MSCLYLLDDPGEVARRRAQLPAGNVVEAWADLYIPGLFWLGEESKRVLDSAGSPVAAHLALPALAVPVYYGPQLSDIDSLPPEDSLKARVLSGHGVAVAWITLDRFGERSSYQPKAPTDPVFHLRRRGGGSGHVWRLFQTKAEAISWMREAYGRDSEGAEWAESLPVDDFDSLLKLGEAP